MTLDTSSSGRGDRPSPSGATATHLKAGRGSLGSVRSMTKRFQRPSELLQAEFDVILPGGRSQKPKAFLCILQGCGTATSLHSLFLSFSRCLTPSLSLSPSLSLAPCAACSVPGPLPLQPLPSPFLLLPSSPRFRFWSKCRLGLASSGPPHSASSRLVLPAACHSMKGGRGGGEHTLCPPESDPQPNNNPMCAAPQGP